MNPDRHKGKLGISENWHGATGLADDVRYYGEWMREEAKQRIGHLYPKVEVTADMAHERPDLKGLIGQKLTVIAWLWTRTVASPNPAFAHINVPLISTFWVSTKAGKEAYVEPILEKKGYKFRVKIGPPKNIEEVNRGTKLARGANFRCIMSNIPMAGEHIKAEGKSRRMGARMLAIVAEGKNGNRRICHLLMSMRKSHNILSRRGNQNLKFLAATNILVSNLMECIYSLISSLHANSLRLRHFLI